MTTEARILADSVSPDGFRLITFQVTFPRMILAEVNTHRMLSKSSASSRAIPVPKQIDRVLAHPFIPAQFGKNQRGMQASENLAEDDAAKARSAWIRARDYTTDSAQALHNLGTHKQLANRLLEPFMWHTAILSCTERDNLYNLRDSYLAQPEFEELVQMMREAERGSIPRRIGYGEWHLPLVFHAENDQYGEEHTKYGYNDRWGFWKKISAARCARTSYLTHDGRRDLGEDLGLHDRILAPGHMGPFEHPARPMTKRELDEYARWHVELENGDRYVTRHETEVGDIRYGENGEPQRVVSASVSHFCGNFNGWVQYRKTIPGEEDIIGYKQRQEQR